MITGAVQDKTDVEKIAYFNNWLMLHNGYNTTLPNEPAWAHQCMSALTGCAGADGPVCEGYAEAFKVLCDHENIPCVSVTGNARTVNNEKLKESGNRQWNNVQIDGKWYAVDVTWNDPNASELTYSGSERSEYLLIGGDTPTTIIGTDNKSYQVAFKDTHPVENIPSKGYSNIFEQGIALEAGNYFSESSSYVPIGADETAADVSGLQNTYHYHQYSGVNALERHNFGGYNFHSKPGYATVSCSECMQNAVIPVNEVKSLQKNSATNQITVSGTIYSVDRNPDQLIIACYRGGKMLGATIAADGIEPAKNAGNGAFYKGSFHVKVTLPEAAQADSVKVYFLNGSNPVSPSYSA